MGGKETLFGLLRISLGWVFFWAFIDKLFGLGFATEPDKAWILGLAPANLFKYLSAGVFVKPDTAVLVGEPLSGNSPTTGFLKFATTGPFAEFYQSLAGNPIVDWLFMIGLLLIGLSLLLGVLVRIAGLSGAVMLGLMFTAVLPPENNPLVDDHIVYALVLLLFMFVPVGEWIGFGKFWARVTNRNPWLR